jgi:hypothetical protein
LALLLAGSFLSKISSALIRGSALSSIDRTLGLPFGLARGYLIGACALFACCALTGGTLPAVVEEAQLFPFLRPGAAWICSLVEPILGKDGVSLSGLMESSSSVRERVEDFVAPRVRKQEHQEENIDSLVQHS